MEKFLHNEPRKNCFRLQEKLCVFLNHNAINFPGNDALLQEITKRMISAFHQSELEKMKRFLMFFNRRANTLCPEDISKSSELFIFHREC
jgi:hypothetical protein